MEFSPFNPIVKLCLQGMNLEDQRKSAEALQVFTQAWNEATNDFEKFLAAHYCARHQSTEADTLKWLELALNCALKVEDETIKSAFSSLYLNIANCYEKFGNSEKTKEHLALSEAYKHQAYDQGPFYHGTKADLKVGDVLIAGGLSNYKTELKMNHIYFTALANGAGLAAALAKGDGQERVYIIEPTGSFENDPNVTDKKFPGNPTRSYRSESPLKIIGEIKEWLKPTPDALKVFRDKLDSNKGEIIN
jgi:rifampin ADP-ribosylating transferase